MLRIDSFRNLPQIDDDVIVEAVHVVVVGSGRGVGYEESDRGIRRVSAAVGSSKQHQMEEVN